MSPSLRVLSVLSGLSFVIAGCSGARPSDEAGSDASELVGVDDLKKLEQTLGLEKDVADAQGGWKRPEATLTDGGCYKKTIGGATPERWKFRRYVNGAAFYEKRDVAAGITSRPLFCVDVDVPFDTWFGKKMYSLDGLILDATIRYGFGKPKFLPGDHGDSGDISFTNGDAVFMPWSSGCTFLSWEWLEYSDASVEEPLKPKYARDAGLVALRDEYLSCRHGGGSKKKCKAEAVKSCTTARKKQASDKPLDYPSFGFGSVYGLGPFKDAPDSVLSNLVYQYAWSKATNADIYEIANDPVGNFIETERLDDNHIEHVRFQRLDAHRVISTQAKDDDPGVETLYITPKLSDGTLVESAIVTCSRSVTGTDPYNPDVTGDFVCKGL